MRQVLERERGRRLFDSVVTTNHVLSEVLTLVRTRGRMDSGLRHARAVEVGRQVYAGAFGQLHQATPDEERAAFEYFARHGDKVYSFVDCVSSVIMEKLGIRIAWSVDADFSHRFIAVRGPIA